MEIRLKNWGAYRDNRRRRFISIAVDRDHEIITDKDKERVDRHFLDPYRHRREHDTQFGIVILVRRVKTGGQFRDRDLGKTGDLGDLFDLLVIILRAAVDPGHTCLVDCCKIFFKRLIHHAFDPAVLIENYTETQRDGSVDLGFLLGYSAFS